MGGGHVACLASNDPRKFRDILEFFFLGVVLV